MRLLGRRERQRRNLPCRASPAECCQERRESPLRPFHSFSIGRHLWFGPMRLPPQRGGAGQPIECCSGRVKTFPLGFPPATFLSPTSTQGVPGGAASRSAEFEQPVQARGVWRES